MAVSKRLRFEILKRDGFRCRYCGLTAEAVELRVDHVTPVALGGTDDPSNLVTACDPCNNGKSSMPADAPLVADVADKALAWAQAMRMVAEERAAARSQSQRLYDAFEDEWSAWKDWRGNPLELPPGWHATIDQLLDAGLAIGDLIELVDVAMQARAKDTWRYWCGCCWTRLRKMQDRAAEIIAAQDSPTAPPTLATRWTVEELNEKLRMSIELGEKHLDADGFDVYCHHHGLTGESGHCGDPVCAMDVAATLEARALAACMVELRAEAINDVAEGALDGA